MCSFGAKNTAEVTDVNAVKYLLPLLCESPTDKQELIDAVATHVPPERICAATAIDGSFIVYLKSFEDTIYLLQKKHITFRGISIFASHLVDTFTVCNVPPTVEGDILHKIFQSYGHIVRIDTVPFCSGVPLYNHILGGERRIFVRTPHHKQNFCQLPENIVHNIDQNTTILLTVKKHCVICKTDGHNYFTCPELGSHVSNENEGQSMCNVDISNILVIEKEEPNCSAALETASLVDANPDTHTKEDNSICIPPSTFQYLATTSNVVTRDVQSKDDDHSTANDNSTVVESKASGSAGKVPASNDSGDVSDMEKIPDKNYKRNRKSAIVRKCEKYGFRKRTKRYKPDRSSPSLTLSSSSTASDFELSGNETD